MLFILLCKHYSLFWSIWVYLRIEPCAYQCNVSICPIVMDENLLIFLSWIYTFQVYQSSTGKTIYHLPSLQHPRLPVTAVRFFGTSENVKTNNMLLVSCEYVLQHTCTCICTCKQVLLMQLQSVFWAHIFFSVWSAVHTAISCISNVYTKEHTLVFTAILYMFKSMWFPLLHL